MKKTNSGDEGCELNILPWVFLTYMRVNTMKTGQDVNQGGHKNISDNRNEEN